MCVFVFWLLVGLPQKDGIKNEGRTVFYVLPAGSCWEYLLYHIMSVAETVLKVTKLISSVPVLYTNPARYTRLWHMENRGVGVQTPAGTVIKNNWTTALCIFLFGCSRGPDICLLRRQRADFWRNQSYSTSQNPSFQYVCYMGFIALALDFSCWSLKVHTSICISIMWQVHGSA